MWRNYLTVSVRTLLQSKVYSFVNIFGLTIGIAAFLMLMLYVRYEVSYDSWIPNAENTYQLQTHSRHNEIGESTESQMAPYVAMSMLQKDFPQIENAVYAMPVSPAVLRNGEASAAEDVILVNGPFFDVVRLPLLAGSPRTALLEPNSIVLSESEARKRFGTVDIVGQTLTLLRGGQGTAFRVTGVMRDLPRNSHLRLGMVARIDFASVFAGQEFLSCWVCRMGWLYVALRPGTDPATVQDALPAWERRNIPDQGDFNAGADQDWRLTNVTDIHLGSAQEDASTPGNDRRTILTFSIIALLILVTACINFTNLATARASRRAREVALRKVLGARRRQLIAQFIGESFLISTVAAIIALALVELLTTLAFESLNLDLGFSYFGAGGVALPILLLLFLVGIGSGLYPAFFLSRFQPGTVLKANLSVVEAPRSVLLRNMLVVLQFAVSIGLIVCTMVIYTQTVFARTTDLGFDQNRVLQLEGLNRAQMMPAAASLVRQVQSLEGVEAVGRSGIAIATEPENNMAIQVPGMQAEITAGIYPVDSGFFEAMDIALVAGRNFDEHRPIDDATITYPAEPAAARALASRGINIVVNRLAAERMGFRDPATAIGRQVAVGLLDSSSYGLVPATIVGVVENARFRSIRTPIEPMVFRYSRTGHQFMVVRYSGDPAGLSRRIERIWRNLASETPFAARFGEDIVREIYAEENERMAVFAAFAFIAVIVACLGLFGLAAFTAERRTKEIGLRKVLGAHSRDIVRLLTWQFSKLVIVANLIAWPIAWWVMRDWLNTFDARIDLSPTPFVMAGLIALLVAVGTIAGHAVRVARTNPIHALRYE